MDRVQPRRPLRERGFTLIELMVVVLIVSLLGALAAPMLADAVDEGRKTALAADGKTLYDALMAYYRDNSAFPADDDFDTTTLSPLSDEGYLPKATSITSKLEDQKLMVYLAPDVGGANQQFIIVMRSARDSSVLVGLVYTDLIDDDGDWLDGVYVIDEEDLEDAEDLFD